jgi:DNA-binding CsgD family transcriptional regulator/N-acetylneuraminic acid mutarotase
MTNTGPSELSERELEILRLVATGASNKEIAQKCFISSNTVKVHLRNIFSKIGASSRTEAAMYAVRIGLVEARSDQVVVEKAPLSDNAEGLPISRTDATLEPPANQATAQQVAWTQRWGIVIIAVLLLAAIGISLSLGGSPTSQVQSPTFPSPTSEPTPTAVPRWEEKKAMPHARSKMAVAAFEDQVYVIGGETAQGVTGIVERYNPVTNAWTELADKPLPVADASAAVIGGEIYIPGGRLASGEPTDILEVYDPRVDQWTQRTPLPLPISGYALVAFEGRIYLFGGWGGSFYLNNVFTYDPSLDQWQSRTPMPTKRAYCGAAVAGGRIYVIGGYDGQKALATNEVYLSARDDGDDDPWETAAPLPTGRYGMGVSGVADLIYIIGGKDNDDEALPLLEYSPSQGAWANFSSPIPEIWESLGTIPIGPYIYLIGGLIQHNPTDLNLSYQAIYTIVIPIGSKSQNP